MIVYTSNKHWFKDITHLYRSWIMDFKSPALYGWVYDIESGYIKEQTSMIVGEEALKEVCKFEMGIIGV